MWRAHTGNLPYVNPDMCGVYASTYQGNFLRNPGTPPVLESTLFQTIYVVL